MAVTAPASLPLRLTALRDPLFVGIAVSVVLHLVLAVLRFAPPEPLRLAPTDSRIEVVLLNAKTERRPAKAEVAAQVDMEGGGDRDTGRAKSPLPAEQAVSDGTGLREQRRRVQALEEQQRRLLALAQGPHTFVESERRQAGAQPSPQANDTEEVERAIARLQAQIDRQISDYNKRPKRLTYGVNAIGVSYARYVEDWATKIERIGTARYPPAARGKLYDTMIITVEIDRHGNVVEVKLDRPSKHAVLNRAVREIVLAGAPYERFPPEMAREGDILQIVRTWTFTRNTLSTESVKAP